MSRKIRILRFAGTIYNNLWSNKHQKVPKNKVCFITFKLGKILHYTKTSLKLNSTGIFYSRNISII